MAQLEGVVLDGLDFNGSGLVLEGFACPPPAKRAEWAQGADADGALLIRDPLFENRELTARVRVDVQSTMDLALAKLGALVKKLEECEQQPDGLGLVWTPSQATKSFTFYVLSGTVEDLPVEIEGDGAGWFVKAPIVTVKMTAKPFGYGAEQQLDTQVTSTPFVTVTAAGVPGDVPAEGRLIIQDTASQNRRHVEWGLEQRYYDPATSLLIDSDSLVTSGYLGAGTTRTGAYDPNATGNNVVRATLRKPWSAICSTGPLTHVGTFRVKARVYCTSTAQRIRLAWRDGDGPYRANTSVVPTVAGRFCEVDLGLITINPAQTGSQEWEGHIEAMTSSGLVGDQLDVDYLILIPAGEGYGKARVNNALPAGTLVAFDDFTSTTAGSLLSGRVAPLGGTWGTSGSSTDLVFADGPGSGEETVTRTGFIDNATRRALLGATNYTEVEVGCRFRCSGAPHKHAVAVIARYVNGTDKVSLRVDVDLTQASQPPSLILDTGTSGIVATVPLTLQADTWYRFKLVVQASGRAVGQVLTDSGAVLATVDLIDPIMATGGTLATGLIGFSHTAIGASGQPYFDDFYAETIAAEQFAVYSGRLLEVRSDSVLRQNAAGTVWGRPGQYVGSLLKIPPAGDKNRTVRILVKARRDDVDEGPDQVVTDSTTVTLKATPRYLAVPY